MSRLLRYPAPVTSPPVFQRPAPRIVLGLQPTTVTGGPSREFDGTDDVLTTDNGALSLAPGGAHSIILVVKPASLASGECFVALRASGNSISSLYDNGSGGLAWKDADDTLTASAGLTADAWQIIGFSKPSGTSAVRFHRKEIGAGSWTHATSGGTSTGVPGSPSTITFGAAGTADYKDCRVLCAAVYNAELSDGDFEAVTDATDDLAISADAVAVWDFNQASTGTAVDDLLFGAATETALTGTTVITDGPDGWTFGLAETLDLDASAGTASAAGGTATLAVTLTATTGTATAAGGTAATAMTHTAATGTATAGGGTAALAVTYTAATGAGTAAGGTASLAVTLTAATGTATAAGGTATATVEAPPAAVIVGRGRAASNIVQTVSSPPAFVRRTLASGLVQGLTPPAGVVSLSADGGAATTGGTVSLAFTFTVATGTAAADGGTATVSTAAPPPGTVIAPGRPSGAVRAITYPPAPVRARVSATVQGLTPSGAAVLDLTASTGVATAAGPVIATTLALDEGSGTATADGGTATASTAGGLNLTAATGTAAAAGGASALALTWTAATGTATAGGGTATASTGGTSAQGGTASASGGTAGLSWTYVAAAGAASAAGGTATSSSTTGLTAQNGTATASGGTASFRIIVTAAAGAASASGGIVERVNPAAAGTATASGTVLVLRWTLEAVSGNATASGTVATAFAPTLGTIDGSAGTATVVDAATGFTASVESAGVLTGSIG